MNEGGRTQQDLELAPNLREAIERFRILDSALVATDFDGVLAPLVLDPMSSRPQPGTIEALKTLAGQEGVTVAVASGRDLATLRQLTGLSDDDGIVLIGSHGAESNVSLTAGAAAATGALSETEKAALTEATHAVEAIAARLPEARVEYKPAGVVLHTRGMDADAAATAERAALAVPHDVPGVHAMRGKSVIELSVLDVSKGGALAALMASRGARAMAYFGDDVTDETVFTTLDTARGDLGVKVGEGQSAARFRVDTCERMPAILEAFLEAATRG